MSVSLEGLNRFERENATEYQKNVMISGGPDGMTGPAKPGG